MLDIELMASKLGLTGCSVTVLDIQTLISHKNGEYTLYAIVDNKVVKSIAYNDIKPDVNAKLAVVKFGDNFGLIKFDTEEIIKPIYKNIKIYDSELISLHDKGLVGIFNKDLEQLTPMIYRYIKSILKTSEGLYIITLGGRESGSTVNYTYINNKCTKLNIGITPINKYCADGYLVGYLEGSNDKQVCYNLHKNSFIYIKRAYEKEGYIYIEYEEDNKTKFNKLGKLMEDLTK